MNKMLWLARFVSVAGIVTPPLSASAGWNGPWGWIDGPGWGNNNNNNNSWGNNLGPMDGFSDGMSDGSGDGNSDMSFSGKSKNQFRGNDRGYGLYGQG